MPALDRERKLTYLRNMGVTSVHLDALSNAELEEAMEAVSDHPNSVSYGPPTAPRQDAQRFTRFDSGSVPSSDPEADRAAARFDHQMSTTNPRPAGAYYSASETWRRDAALAPEFHAVAATGPAGRNRELPPDTKSALQAQTKRAQLSSMISAEELEALSDEDVSTLHATLFPNGAH